MAVAEQLQRPSHELAIDALPEVTVSSRKQTRSNGTETGSAQAHLDLAARRRRAESNAKVIPAS